MKTNQNLGAAPNNSSHHDHGGGSFAAGFVMGVLTGAAGMWMSQNDTGRELLQHLKKEILETIEHETNGSFASDKKTSSAPATPGTGSEKKFPKFAVKRIRRS